MSTGSAYEFAAQDAASGDWVVLEITESSEGSIRYLEKVWHKLAQAVSNACSLREHDKRAPSWTTWKPHEWSRKAVPDRVKFVAWDGDTLAGFLNLRTGLLSEVDGEPIIYVEHVATFPGNIPTDLWERRLKRVGVALLAFAVLQAHVQGCGRIGLHADADAVSWYDQIHAQFDNLFEVRKTGVSGPHPSHSTQLYFESSVSGAATLLEHYRNA